MMLRNMLRKIAQSLSVIMLAWTFLLPLNVQAQEFSQQQTEIIKNMIREFMFKNPQALREAIINLQAFEREQQQKAARLALSQYGKSLFRSPNSYVAGNPDGDVTLVEFFDYNCGFCRRSMADLMALINTDPNLKVVFKEFPILGEGSDFAARAAMASIKQGKYMEFHMAMMKLRGSADKNSVMEIAEEVGLDTEKLKQEMKASYITEEIRDAQRTASAIGINGTPGFVIGDRVIGGAVGLAELRRQIALVRKSGS